MKEKVLERFLKYVKVDTEAEYGVLQYPSTKKQLDLAKILVDECKSLGLSNVESDEFGYVTALLPSNIEKKVPTVSFIAHMDTSPDFSGKDVNPIIHENYDGADIILKNDNSILTKEFPFLKNYIGQTLITADGTTLLGADDKAGVAEILTAVEYLINNPSIPHGDVKIAFTPDEEVGRGTDFFNVKKFDADFGYTLDGGEIGEFEYENFNAARILINITGKSIHPGSSKNLMVNSVLIGNEILNKIPPNQTPRDSEGYEGFYHVVNFNGTVAETKINIIIRDFDKNNFAERKQIIENIINDLNLKYENRIELIIKDEYFNMFEIIEKEERIISLAKKAYEEASVKVNILPVRGGTDGARLSFMGLPCPNIFTGGHNFHGPQELICVESMVKACEVVINICKFNAE